MRRQRQKFPYERGSSIFLRSSTLNLLAQVRGPGERWTDCLERIIRVWAREHEISLMEQPTLEDGVRTRQAAATAPLFEEEETEHAKH